MERQQDERTLFEYERDMYSPIAQRQMEEYALEEEKAKNTRSTFRTFLDNFSGNLQRESDRKLAENKALTEYLQTPEGKEAMKTAGIASLSLLPIPGMKRILGSRLARFPFNRDISAPAQQPFGSGSSVGTDVAGRIPMPMSRAPVPTNRGPRGPINIEQPTQLPLPLRGGRNTGGVSETDQAMIKMQQSQQGIMNTPAALKSSPTQPLKSRGDIRQDRKLQKLREEQSQLRAYANMVNSMRQQGEATEAQMRNLEQITARLNFLNKTLK